MSQEDQKWTAALRRMRGAPAWLAALAIYSVVIATSHVGRFVAPLLRPLARRRRGGRAGQRLLLTGTFYNVGWFRSHVTPLARCRGLGEVIVVSDQALPAVLGVRVLAPPRWLARVCGVALARGLCVLHHALRERPDILMGYHIMPNALMCLAAGRLAGARVFYQMTGGPTQVLGGGHRGENALLRRLTWSSRTLEALAFHAVRQFDAVIVRGSKAAGFLKQHGLARSCLIIPGSVDCERFAPGPPGSKGYDLICVARLVPVKRYERLLPIVAALHARGCRARLALVGDGPLEPALRAQAQALGIAEQVAFLGQRDDVPALLARSRAFVLTSDIEGLSIAMMEALAAGLPAFAPRIGDLGELLLHGTNGLFIDPDRPDEAAAQIAEVLDDPARLAALGQAARETAQQRVSLEAVVQLWEAALNVADRRPAPAVDGDHAAARPLAVDRKWPV